MRKLNMKQPESWAAGPVGFWSVKVPARRVSFPTHREGVSHMWLPRGHLQVLLSMSTNPERSSGCSMCPLAWQPGRRTDKAGDKFLSHASQPGKLAILLDAQKMTVLPWYKELPARPGVTKNHCSNERKRSP